MASASAISVEKVSPSLADERATAGHRQFRSGGRVIAQGDAWPRSSAYRPSTAATSRGARPRRRTRSRRRFAARARRSAIGRAVPLDERTAAVLRGVEALGAMNEEIVSELALQMGRPIRYGGEFRGVEERARHMASIARARARPDRARGEGGLPAHDQARAARASCSSSRPGTIPISRRSTRSCRR